MAILAAVVALGADFIAVGTDHIAFVAMFSASSTNSIGAFLAGGASAAKSYTVPAMHRAGGAQCHTIRALAAVLTQDCTVAAVCSAFVANRGAVSTGLTVLTLLVSGAPLAGAAGGTQGRAQAVRAPTAIGAEILAIRAVALAVLRRIGAEVADAVAAGAAANA